MNESGIDTSHPVVLFDGVCNLCSSSVQYIIKRDKKNLFRFASLQSEIANKMLKGHNLSTTEFDSFVLIENGEIYKKSTGALKVAKNLSGAIKLCYGFIIVPAFIRDVVYNLVAGNRYRWFGKKEACWIPTPEISSRFLDAGNVNGKVVQDEFALDY